MILTAQNLRRLAARTLQDAGVESTKAQLIADVLSDADVRGHPSHGVGLLPLYLDRIRLGGIVADAEPECTGAAPVMRVEAHGGPGQLAAMAAARACAGAAREYGIAAATVYGGNHIGMLAAYRKPYEASGCIGLILNVSGPSVAPPGGAHATLGNNACCLIVPRRDDRPFIVDFATGTVACGKLRQAAMRGERVPEGWLLDGAGRPTTDPHELDAGGSVPVFGGYKGLGLSLIVEVLGGILGGGRTSPDVRRQRHAPDEVMHCGQMFVGFFPPAFGVEDPAPMIGRLEEAVRASYPNGTPETWFPEQQEARAVQRHDDRGIEIPDAVAAQLGWAVDGELAS